MPDFDDYLIASEFPENSVERMVVAFRGWPDAGDAATATLNYLLTTFNAEKFAEIDPEEFFNFAQERPRSTRGKDGTRHLQWPANEFYLWRGSANSPPVVLYLGTEPHLRWRTFSSLVGDVARRCGVKSFDKSSIRSSNYQGPSGITLPISESLAARGISYTSLWGHVSHYLHATPNFRVSLGLARYLSDMLAMPIDLGKLYSMADAFDREVEKVIAEDEQLGKYILTLEERYDAASESREMPNPAELVMELEQFLRAERGGGL